MLENTTSPQGQPIPVPLRRNIYKKGQERKVKMCKRKDVRSENGNSKVEGKIICRG
jgi:hypothetical protein